MGDPHVMLQLGHVFFGGRFLRERPGQHELALKYRRASSTMPSRVAAIQGIAECLT